MWLDFKKLLVVATLKINFTYINRNFKKKFVVSSGLTGLCFALT
jgi:hypothetical protein